VTPEITVVIEHTENYELCRTERQKELDNNLKKKPTMKTVQGGINH